jgi:hypothetical protein
MTAMMRRKLEAVNLAPIDLLKYYYEGREPERRQAIMFGIAVKHGIPMSNIRRIDHESGVMEYYR